MNANRKADLQRKLAMTPAPAPPAGLAERIKREIPKDLRVETTSERKRPEQWLGVSLRVAASLLVVTIGAWWMLRVMSRTGAPNAPGATNELQAPAAQFRAKQKAPVSAVMDETSAPAAKELAVPPPQGAAAPPPPAQRETANVHETAKIARPAIEEQRAENGSRVAEAVSQPSEAATPAAAAPAPSVAATGGVARTENIAAQATMKTAGDAAQTARLNVEATISPSSGKMIVRVTVVNAPQANVDVEGAEKLAADLYAVDGESARIRLQYRQDGEVKTLERSISRADARAWDDASKEMKDAVKKAEKPQ